MFFCKDYALYCEITMQHFDKQTYTTMQSKKVFLHFPM